MFKWVTWSKVECYCTLFSWKSVIYFDMFSFKQKMVLRENFKTALKEIDKQLTYVKELLKMGVLVSDNVSRHVHLNCVLWTIQNLANEEVLDFLTNNGIDVNFSRGTPLTCAVSCSNNSLNKVKLLISKGADVNKPDTSGHTPLTNIAQFKSQHNLAVAECLLEHGADINLTGYEGKTPLSWAVIKKNSKMVEFFLKNGANPNQLDKDGETPLRRAQRGDKRILEILLTPHSARQIKKIISVGDGESSPRRGGAKTIHKGKTTLLLHDAIASENEEIVQHLIQRKVNVCKRDVNGKTPLSLAVQKSNPNIITLLLENGASLTIQSAFLEAISSENLKIVELLITKGVLLDVTYKNGHTPLTNAIETGNVSIIKTLIENGADIELPRRDGALPLSLAIETSNVEIINLILNNTGRLPSTSNANFDSLLKFIEDDNINMVRVLVGIGAKVGVIYEGEETPLTKAVKSEKFEIVKYLVKKGADVNKSNSEGKVPLAIAASNRDIRIVDFLIRSEANLDLAIEEVKEFAESDDDFAIYLETLKRKCYNWRSIRNVRLRFEDSGQDAAN